MSLDRDHPALAGATARLSPYLRGIVAAAAHRALELAADELELEHLLIACLRDEDCALYELVVHAFADPETVEIEVTALSSGVMVVGSGAALPFSPSAIAALERARTGRARVTPADVLHACMTALPSEAADAVTAAGWTIAPTAAGEAAAGTTGSASFFGPFDDEARRALSAAGRAAGSARETSISPARIALACAAVAGAARAVGRPLREVLRPWLRDATPPTLRPLAPTADLAASLAGLDAEAGTLDVLTAALHGESAELRALCQRHKLTEALLERSRGAFRDPAP